MNQEFLTLAEQNLPPIRKSEIVPVGVFARLSSGSDVITPGGVVSPLLPGDSVTLDLGDHYVGRLCFRMERAGIYIDAPVTLRIRFCEVERELCDDYTVYTGWLCRSWLQEDQIKVDFPGEVSLSRRYAARYIRITVEAAPKPIALSDFRFTAETSADVAACRPFPIADPFLARMDRVGVNTLKNCMQRVFEDGPKRDRRLWIGDLRLEALADYYTFGQTDLVRRCLCLFAAADKNERGMLPGFVYENPAFFPGNWFLTDYSLMYVCALCDYEEYSGDGGTFLRLLPTARAILTSLVCCRDGDGMVTSPEEDIFIDWCEGLEKKIALQGVFLYTLGIYRRALSRLALPEEFSGVAEDVRAAVRKKVGEDFVAVHSVHEAVWLTLGGIAGKTEAKALLGRTLRDPQAKKPCTPYMWHYTLEALILADEKQAARDVLDRIWGGMLRQGGDTFFEAFVPGDPDFSPYGDRKVNSMCHAWSCTATYFLRKYSFFSENTPIFG